MAEKLRYGDEYDRYKAIIKQANYMSRRDAVPILSKVQMELFKKYGFEDEKVKELIKMFDYSVD